MIVDDGQGARLIPVLDAVQDIGVALDQVLAEVGVGDRARDGAGLEGIRCPESSQLE